MVVHSLDGNSTVFEFNPDKLLIPASTMKVVTLAVAAERLGWDHTFETTLLGVGAVDFGYLDGDLMVVGSGDPTIDDWDGAATRLFQSWAEQLKAQGVRTIGGRIVGDDNAFEDEGLGPGWAWDDLGASFATGVGALQFNQNAARLVVSPGPHAGAPAVARVTPHQSGLMLQSALTTAPAGQPPTLVIHRPYGSAVLALHGDVPADAAPLARTVAVANPTQYFVSALRDALVANGIEVRGAAVDIDDLVDPPSRDDGVRLVTHRSPPLTSIGATMMKVSQNLFADTLLKAVGDGEVRSLAAGRLVTRTLLEQWGLGPLDVLMTDGSGLSRYNLLTARALVAILGRVERDARLGAAFQATLPVAGREGTLAERMKGTAADGNARAKSGSLSNVRGLAGYVRAADGERLAFAILANHFGTPPDVAERAIDAIVARLARFSR
jgi:D-alanyl-D-alanine carboxypeptidase/D-alanyl-D-alanine-endopeptidase (penicillin-binding protein 4)